MSIPLSPLAPETIVKLQPLSGVNIGATALELRYKNRPDVMLATFDKPATVAGVFTLSQTAAVSVEYGRASLKTGKGARAVVVNAGNANAYTGAHGKQALEAVCGAVAKELGCAADEVYMSSTGVIGEPLAFEKILSGLPKLFAATKTQDWQAAARAICTTDTFIKTATRQVDIDGKTITFNGFAKGSGMIAPNMATMLGYIFTDAVIPQVTLQSMLAEATDKSFNAITVDSDTSTNDTVLCFATNVQQILLSEHSLNILQSTLNDLCQDLALQVVKDGEGAEKLITLKITGAESDKAARVIGLAIGNSPLVKTALAASDANWGRIIGAIGKPGEKINPEAFTLKIGGVLITANGARVPNYDETPVAAHLQTRDVLIEVDVAVGNGSATVWTCDLTHRYIDINAGYRS
jgi:glutamate N-acetyltransferase/amino-acid N-acetyltransferase